MWGTVEGELYLWLSHWKTDAVHKQRMGLEAENGLWQSGRLSTKDIANILDIFIGFQQQPSICQLYSGLFPFEFVLTAAIECLVCVIRILPKGRSLLPSPLSPPTPLCQSMPSKLQGDKYLHHGCFAYNVTAAPSNLLMTPLTSSLALSPPSVI